jgi:hypothetical protein
VRPMLCSARATASRHATPAANGGRPRRVPTHACRELAPGYVYPVPFNARATAFRRAPPTARGAPPRRA